MHWNNNDKQNCQTILSSRKINKEYEIHNMTICAEKRAIENTTTNDGKHLNFHDVTASLICPFRRM